MGQANTKLIAICHHCNQLDLADKTGSPPCKASGQHFIEHVRSGCCPRQFFALGLPQQAGLSLLEKTSLQQANYDGSKLWARIHVAGTKHQLIALLSEVPCGPCKNHAAAYLKAHRIPDDTSLIAQWTFDFHNAVNVSLGKPLFAWDEFLRAYPRL